MIVANTRAAGPRTRSGGANLYGLLLLAAAQSPACLDAEAVVDPASGGGPSFEPTSQGQSFYVSPRGDDEASGLTRQDAWRSLARVNRLALRPGDRVLLEGGASFAGGLALDALDGGDPEQPVRIGSYGAGRASIDAGDGDAVVITDASGVIVERLILRGGWLADAQSGNEGEGVRATGTQPGVRSQGLRLRELDIAGFKYAGIGLHARPATDVKDSGYEDVEISDCDVHDNGDFGLLSDGPYIYDGPGYSHRALHVRGVRASFNRGLKNKGEHTGSGIVLSDVDGAVIEHSIAHDNGELNDHSGGGGFGIWAWDANRVTIQFNEAYRNRTSTTDGGGFDLDGGATNSVLQYNYSHDNQGAGYGAFQFAWARAFEGNRIQYNVSQNDGVAFLVWDGNGDMGSLAVVHNVGYGAEPVLMTHSPFEAVSVANNVFFGTGPLLFDVFDGAGLELQGNAYWTEGAPLRIDWDTGKSAPRTFADFDAYRAATGQETLDADATGLYADPRLIAAGTGPTLDDTARLSELGMYELGEDSPLIDRGIDLTRLSLVSPASDFFGSPSPRGAAPDIGVHELP
jgi:Right handed beta helix region